MMVTRYGIGILVILGGILLHASAAHGVVVDTGDGNVNSVAPTDDPGFGNAGIRGAGTGIYLGNRWVMTANHNGAGPVTFGDQTFQHLPAETVRLRNPVGKGLSADTDILLLRLEEEPNLPNLRLGCHSVPSGSEVLLIGAGRDRDAELSAWNVQIGPGNRDDVWTATADLDSADQVGFRTNATRTIRWGNAPAVITNQHSPTAGNGDVISFLTLFDRFDNSNALRTYSGITNVSRAVTGDSGGPVFRKNGDFWELAGMIHGVTRPEENQPGGAGTALLGTWTFVADLFAYRSQISEVAEFGPQLGDFNNDGLVDVADIDTILTAVREKNHNCHYDLTNNGIVTRPDVNEVLEIVGTLSGDADLDGVVGFPDFLRLARAYGKRGLGWAHGDFDGDDEVTFGDFVLLSNGFGDRFETANASALTITAVPEPTGVCLWLVGCVFALRIRASGTRRRQLRNLIRGSC